MTIVVLTFGTDAAADRPGVLSEKPSFVWGRPPGARRYRDSPRPFDVIL
jgi:hypothetical protein